jgi:hypothetical protein
MRWQGRCCLCSLIPENEAGNQQADGVDGAANTHEVCGVLHDAVSSVVVAQDVVDKNRHVKFSREWLSYWLDRFKCLG